MKYSREFDFNEGDCTLKLQIDYRIPNEGDPQYLEGCLRSKNKCSNIDGRMKIRGKHGVKVSPSIITSNDLNESVDLDVYLPPDTSNVEISLEADDNEIDGKIIEFGDRSILALCNEILEQDHFDRMDFLYRARHIFEGERDFWVLFNFSKEISSLLNFEDYLELISETHDKFPDAWGDLEQVLNIILTQLLTGEIASGRHEITNLSHMEEVIDALSNINKAVEPDPQESLSYAIERLDERGKIEYTMELIRNFNIVDTYPEILTDRIFYILLAEEIHRRSDEGVQNAVQSYFSKDEDEGEFEEDTYDRYKQEALEAKKEKRAEKWRSVVEYARCNPNDHDFKFIVSNLLYSVAESRKNDPQYYQIVPKLYGAAAIWFNEIDLDVHRRARHESHYRRGLYLYHNSNNHSESSEEFSKAIEISMNTDGEYDSIEPSWAIHPIIYKSLSDSNKAVFEGDDEKAADILQERLDLVKDLEVLRGDQAEQIISALSGERFQILADIHLREGEYERAAEKASQAIGLFTEGGLDRASKKALRKKKEIDAVVNEVNGDFKDAARRHAAIADNDAYSEEKRKIHEVRNVVCLSKHHCLNGNYKKAKEKIRELSTKQSKLKDEDADLAILINLLVYFEEGRRADIRTTLEKTSTMKELTEYQHPLDVGYDYTEPIVFILSLQDLRNSEVPNSLLQTMIEGSVNRSFMPTRDVEIADEVHLGDISIDRLWRERLPSPVLSRIEQIQLEKTTAFGDYKSLTLSLAELLEFHLALVVEYYAQRCWGSDWRSRLVEDDEDESNLSIGTLSKIFTVDANLKIENQEKLRSIYFESKMGYNGLTDMRNKYDHAYEGTVEKEEFDELQDWVFEFLRRSVSDAPLIFSVKDTNTIGLHYVRLYWWRGIRHVLINTEKDLEEGEYYYIPVDVIKTDEDSGSYTILREDIYPVEDERVREQLEELD